MQGGFWSGLGGQGAELRPLTEAFLPLVVTYANGSNGRTPGDQPEEVAGSLKIRKPTSTLQASSGTPVSRP